MTGNKRLDFRDGPNDDADTEFLKGIVGKRLPSEFCLKTPKVVFGEFL